MTALDDWLLEERQKENESMLPDDTPAQCEGDCGWYGTIAECDVDTESEGWEYPTYQVLNCPICGEPVYI